MTRIQFPDIDVSKVSTRTPSSFDLPTPDAIAELVKNIGYAYVGALATTWDRIDTVNKQANERLGAARDDVAQRLVATRDETTARFADARAEARTRIEAAGKALEDARLKIVELAKESFDRLRAA